MMHTNFNVKLGPSSITGALNRNTCEYDLINATATVKLCATTTSSNYADWTTCGESIRLERQRFVEFHRNLDGTAQGNWLNTSPFCYWPDENCTTAAVTARPYWVNATLNDASTCKIHVYTELFPKKPSEALKDMLAARMAPRIIVPTHRNPTKTSQEVRELRARETLKRVVGGDRYRNFLKTGFVSLRGPDGYNYQIHPGHGITNVFDQGKMINRLCVVFPGGFTPTDSLIMRFLMIMNNPKEFWEKAIKHPTYNRNAYQQTAPDNRSLGEIYSSLKKNYSRTMAA